MGTTRWLRLGIDASGVRAGAGEAKSSLAAIKAAAREAGVALQGAGADAAKAAEVTVSSLRAQTASMTSYLAVLNQGDAALRVYEVQQLAANAAAQAGIETNAAAVAALTSEIGAQQALAASIQEVQAARAANAAAQEELATLQSEVAWLERMSVAATQGKAALMAVNRERELAAVAARLGISANSEEAQSIAMLTERRAALTAAIESNNVAEASFGGAISRVRSAVMGLGGILAAVGITVFTSQVVSATTALQRINNTLTVATGSSAAAGQEFKFIEEQASRLGLGLQQAATSYAKFAAASRNTSLEGQGARDVFVAVSEASAAMGLSAEDAAGALNALQQMVSKGNVQAEELRGQLGERIPGAFRMAAEAMGVTTQELNKMLDTGKVLATDLLPKLAEVMHNTFGGTSEDAAKKLQGSINSLSTEWFKFRAAVGEAGLSEAFATGVRGLTEFVTWSRANLPSIITLVKSLTAALAALAAVWAVNNFEAGVSAAVRGLLALRTAASGAAASLGPLGIALAAVAAAAMLIPRMVDDGTDALTDMDKAAMRVGEAMRVEVSDALDQAQENVRQLAAAVEEASRLSAEAVRAQERMAERRQQIQQQLANPAMTSPDMANLLRAELSSLDEGISRATNTARVYDSQAQHLNETLTEQTAILDKAAEKAKKDAEEKAKAEAAAKKRAAAEAQLAEQYASTMASLEVQIRQQKELAEAHKKGAEAVAAVERSHAGENAALALGNLATKEQKASVSALASAMKGLEQEAAKAAAIEDALAASLENGNDLLDKQAAAAAAAATAIGHQFASASSYIEELEKALKAAEDAASGVKRTAEEIASAAADAAALAFERDRPDFFARMPEQAEAAKQKVHELVYETTLLNEQAKTAGKSFSAIADELAKNTLQRVGASLSDFFATIFSGGKASFKDLVQEIGKLFAKLLADMLTQWILNEALKTAETAKAAATRAAIERASQAAGGGGGGGATGGINAGQSGYGSTIATGVINAGQSGYGSTIAWGGAFVAVVALILAWQKSQKEYWAKIKLSFDETGKAIGEAVPKKGMLSTFTAGMQQLQKEVGPWGKAVTDIITSINGVLTGTIEGQFVTLSREGRGKNTKWAVELANGIVLQFGKDMNAAMEFAVIQGVKQAKIGGISPLMRQAIRDSVAKTLDEFQKQLADVAKVEQIINPVGAGIRAFTSEFDRLRAVLVGMLHPSQELTNALNQLSAAEVQRWQDERDAITGRQKTAAEERADRERRALLFNAELAMRKAELEAKRASLEAELELAKQGFEFERQDLQAKQDLENAKQEIIREQATDEQNALTLAAGYLYAQDVMLNAAAQALQDQINAIDQILANLPKAIDLNEIHLGGGGGGHQEQPRGGGGYSGPSKQDRIQAVEDRIRELTEGLLPDFLQRLASMRRDFAELAKEAAALGMSTEELSKLEEQYLQQLRDQAQAEVDQYTKNPLEAQLEEIYAWRDQMLEVFQELGLSLADVEAGVEARLHQLGQSVLQQLGSPTANTIARFSQLAEALNFLRDNFDKLGLSAEQLGQITAEVGAEMAMSLVDSLLQFVDDEDARKQLEQVRFQLEVANIMLQFELLKALGLLNQDQIDLIQGLIDALPDAPPDLGGDTGHGGFTGQGGGQEGGFGDKGGKLRQAIDRLRAAIDRLREFQEGLLQDTSVSPLTLNQRFNDAQQSYLETLAAAQAGDVSAIERLPDVAQQYLELAAQMYGTASAGYQDIFQSVYDAVGAIIDQFQPALDEWDLLHSDNQQLGGILDHHTQLFQQMLSNLQQIAQSQAGPPGGGLPAPPEGVPGGLESASVPFGLGGGATWAGNEMEIPSKKQRNPGFSAPVGGGGLDLSPLSAGISGLREEVAGLREDHRESARSTRDALFSTASASSGMVRHRGPVRRAA